jgi:RNA polymerase sigma factor (sigma-70 family)
MKENNTGSDWFLLFKEGNKDAFRQVFENHYRPILYFASSILQQDSYAEDLVSETFRKAWEYRNRFETPRHLENFLFFVTRNACISYLRWDRTIHSTEQEWARLKGEIEKANPSIDLERVQARLIELLYNHLSTLSGGDVLRMSYLEGKTTQEIAEKLNISENSVYIIKSRSLRLLREILRKDGLVFLFLLGLRIFFKIL